MREVPRCASEGLVPESSRDYSETAIQRKARFAERPQIISAYTQPASHKALPERSFKTDDRKREDPHPASETAAQREARLVDRPEFSANNAMPA